MSTDKGHTDPETVKRLEREVEKQQAIGGIIQTEVQEILKQQAEVLSLVGNTKNWKVAYATGADASTFMTLFADNGKMINLVRVILSSTNAAASSILLQIVDRGGTARTFCRRLTGIASGTERYNEVLDFGGVRLDEIRGSGATFNVMPVYGVEPGARNSPRFAITSTGTGTFDATVVYYESEAATY